MRVTNLEDLSLIVVVDTTSRFVSALHSQTYQHQAVKERPIHASISFLAQ